MRLRTFLTATGVACALAITTSAGWAGGYLGIQMQELTPALVEALDLDDDATGVLVSEVVADSPAEAAGLRNGDIILGFDGRDVSSTGELRRWVSRADGGEAINLEIIRRGQRQTLSVVMGDTAKLERRRDRNRRAPRTWTLDGDDGDQNSWRFDGDDGKGLARFFVGRGQRLGIRVEPVSDDLGRYFGAEKGLLVLEVFDDTAAATAGMQVGDVIVSVAGDAVENAGDIHEILADYSEGDEVAVGIIRDRNATELAVTVEESRGLNLGQFFEGDGPSMFRFDGRDGNDFRVDLPRRMQRHHEDEESLDELREELRDLRKRLRKLEENDG